MSMKPEHALGNLIEIECGKLGWASFHGNVGKFKMIKKNYKTGKNEINWFDTGIPVGFPDYHILTSIVGTIYVETKIKPRRPSAEQIVWLNWLNKNGYYARLIYTIEEFNDFVNEIIADHISGSKPRQLFLDEKGVYK